MYLNCSLPGPPTPDANVGFVYAVRETRVAGYPFAHTPPGVLALAFDVTPEDAQREIDFCRGIEAAVKSKK